MRGVWARFDDLSPRRLHDLLRLRQAVFVLEQQCLYADIDGLDPVAEHLCLLDERDRLLGALRLLPPGQPYTDAAALGRLVVDPAVRGRGLARSLMEAGLRRMALAHPGSAVRISAQQHLEGFYASLGWQRQGEPYLEDGIPHVGMWRAAPILAADTPPSRHHSGSFTRVP